jgi:Tol biopolymer transport system component
MRCGSLCVVFLSVVGAPFIARAGEATYGGGATYHPPQASPNGTAPVPSSLKVSAEAIGTEGMTPQRVAISPNGQHIAFVTQQGSRTVAVIDGKAGPKFDSIESIGPNMADAFLFSPDGKRCAYVGKKSDQLTVVVDDQPIPGGLQVKNFHFSPDGAHYAFTTIAANNDPWFEVFDGKPQSQAYVSEPLEPMFSSDGKHFAYHGTVKFTPQKFGDLLMMDGQPQTSFGKVREFQFSADGKHWAFIGDDAAYVKDPNHPTEKSHLIVDGTEKASFPRMSHLILSPDGTHVAMIFGRDQLTDYTAWLDGKTWDFTYTSSAWIQPAMTDDGSKLAYLQWKMGGKKAVVVNGKAGLEYNDINNVHFSADNHLYYTATMAGGNGLSMFVVRDEDEFGPYPSTPNAGDMPRIPVFSPDRKHIAYAAGDAKMPFVVRDGKNEKSYQMLFGTLTYSPDSQHLAYLAKLDPSINMSPIERQQYLQKPGHDTGNYLVIDDKTFSLPDSTLGYSALAIVFSPDSKHTLMRTGLDSPFIDGHQLAAAKVQYNGASTSSTTCFFTPDSKHIVFGRVGAQGSCMSVDNDDIPGYPPLNVSQGSIGDDGKLIFFAMKAGSTVPYKVSVDMGPERNFGINSSRSNTTVAQNQPQQTPQQQPQNPNQQQQQQQNQNQSTASDIEHKTQEGIDKAKDAGNSLKNLFKKHH